MNPNKLMWGFSLAFMLFALSSALIWLFDPATAFWAVILSSGLACFSLAMHHDIINNLVHRLLFFKTVWKSLLRKRRLMFWVALSFSLVNILVSLVEWWFTGRCYLSGYAWVVLTFSAFFAWLHNTVSFWRVSFGSRVWRNPLTGKKITYWW